MKVKVTNTGTMKLVETENFNVCLLDDSITIEDNNELNEDFIVSNEDYVDFYKAITYIKEYLEEKLDVEWFRREQK